MAELERKVRELIKEDVEAARGKVRFVSECKEKKELFSRVRLEPSRFKTPPELYIHCKNANCNTMLRVRTSPAKAREIESWARRKGLYVTKAPLMLRTLLPPGEVAIEATSSLDRLETTVESLVSQFKREVEK